MGGYDKGYKNLFVCILIYFNKKYIFSELLKNVRIIKKNLIQALLIYELDNNNNLKNINYQNFAHFMRGFDKGFYGINDLIVFTKNWCNVSSIINLKIWMHHLKLNIKNWTTNMLIWLKRSYIGDTKI